MSKKTFLDSIQSPLPCSKDWDKMTGGDQIRFCQSCEKNVYNLSAMPRREARKLVAQNAGKICVRYVRLPNGKVQTADTKLYKIAGRASRLAAGILGASLTLSAIANAQTQPPPKSATQKTSKNQEKDYPKTSQISFTIYDQTDAVVPNQEVELINQKTKEEFTVLANENGIAQFNIIPHGTYDLIITGNGFPKDQRTIKIEKTVEPNIKIILRVGGGVGVFIVDWSEIPLFRAIAQEDNETVKQLINSDFNINTKDESGQTALHVAVEHGNLEIIRFLLDKGAKVSVKDKEKHTPLAMFFETDAKDEEIAKEIVHLLVSKGADINVRDEDNQTFLMRACEDDNLEGVRLFLELGANPNLKDEDGETALQKTDSEEIKQILRQYGARE